MNRKTNQPLIKCAYCDYQFRCGIGAVGLMKEHMKRCDESPQFTKD